MGPLLPLALGAAAGTAVALNRPRPVPTSGEQVGTYVPKRSLYDQPSSDVLLSTEPLPLQSEVGSFRSQLEASNSAVSQQVRNSVKGWLDAEERVESRVLSLLPKEEPLVPGIFYVGVSTLAGSIFARNRNIALRLASPITAFAVAAHLLLPLTTHNVSSYFGSLHEQYSPETARMHRDSTKWVRQRYQATVDGGSQFLGDAERTVSEAVNPLLQKASGPATTGSKPSGEKPS